MRVVVLASLALASPANAGAGAIVGVDDAQPHVTAVHATVGETGVMLQVRYSLAVVGGRIARLAWTLDLPPHASVTAATATFGNASHVLELVDAAQASRRFGAIEWLPEGASTRWQVMLEGTREVELSVASAQGGTLALDLQVYAPSCYVHEARYVALPEAWRPALDGALRGRLAAQPPEETCPGPGDARVWLAFPAPEPRAAADRLVAFAGRAALGEIHVARLELDVAGALADPPRELATAIVVDGSRSLSAAEREAQRTFVAAYLREVPADSRVQLVAYARRATALLPAWTTAAQARASGALDRELRRLVPANGSNVDAGVVEAARWLDRATGTRRMIVLTDDRLARRLAATPAKLATLAGPTTLIHVGVLDDGDDLPVRLPGALLEPLALQTGGVAFRTGRLADGARVGWLVRARTLDLVRITAPGWHEHPASTCADQLAEGAGCMVWAEGDALAGPVVVEGYVWGHRVERVLRPDPARALAVARELQFETANSAELQRRAELAARTLNRQWSLYAEWGNQLGYAYALGVRGGTCCGLGTISTTSGSHGLFTRGSPAPPRPPLDLRPQLAAKLASCGATGSVEIETTLDEIVDVTVRGPDGLVKACVEDAIWSTAIRVPPEYPQAITRFTL